MKIADQECSVERAYDLLIADPTLEERERLVTYASLRSHHDYLRELQAARGGDF